MKKLLIFLSLLIFGMQCSVQVGAAQSRTAELDPVQDPRGLPELVLCSQNLENYGLFEAVKARVSGRDADDFQEKQKDLVTRFVRTGCDVIAVQELLGSKEEAARQGLQQIADALRVRTNRIFEVEVDVSNEGGSRVGYLVAKDRAEVLHTVSYARVELPKLTEKQRPRLFSRGPLELQLSVKPRGEGKAKIVNLINFHFKSRAGAQDDPAQLEWEGYRMEMAEALRRIVENRHAQSFADGETLLVLMGDRNSNFDLASAQILYGVLSLKHFQENGPCRLSKRGVPLCQGDTALSQRLFSVLLGDPEVRTRPGTFTFKNVYSWIDDIMMPAESLPFAWKDAVTEGRYESGVVYEPKDASDHALVYVKLNW